MKIFLIIIIAFILIRLGEFISFFARLAYFRKNATEKQRERALKLYRFSIKAGGCSVLTKINYAYIALRHGYIEESEKILKKVLFQTRSVSNIVAAKSSLALVYWKRDDIDKAIELLEEVISSGANTNAYGSLGHMYNVTGDYEKAISLNTMALDYAPNDSIILDNYGTTLFKTGDIKGAKKIYKKLMDNNPTFPEAYVTYGDILASEGDKNGAKKMYKKALEANFTFMTTLTKEAIEQRIKGL
ncbi:MAG: tetratricopeptide repeat protein [Eubacteriales bacterium]|nr:tetratricopeptide repeat protein [Eubacteriales bacterium]